MNPCQTVDCEVGLFEVTLPDVQAIEHFADAVLRDDFFFRKGHWHGLVADSRVRLLAVRVRVGDQPEWSEIAGVVVLYAESILHNLFLAPHWRGCGLGSAVIECVAPSKIRAKVDMSTGDPTGFYKKLGYTHEEAAKGKRGQIRVLTKLRAEPLVDDSEAIVGQPGAAVSATPDDNKGLALNRDRLEVLRSGEATVGPGDADLEKDLLASGEGKKAQRIGGRRRRSGVVPEDGG